jgi:thiol:disulfide interchange protein
MYRFLFCSLFLLFTANSACDASNKAVNHTPPSKIKNPRSIAWVESLRLMPVLELAQQKNMPVFVEFHAEWCAPCKVMEEELFTREDIFGYFNSWFINFRTDYDSESGRALADIYEVKTLPTILFLDPKGVVLERHSGAVNSTLLRSLADAARRKM